MTVLQMHRRIRELDNQIEMEGYAMERDPGRGASRMRILRAERKHIAKELDDFYDDPITQSISL